MLFNKQLKKIQTNADCLQCQYFDRQKKKCKGIGQNCFEYDEKTKTMFDPITKLPINLGGK